MVGDKGKIVLDNSLPNNTGGHALAMVEYHSEVTPKSFVHDNLDELINNHNVGTIALEMPPYMMVFNWAYQDGKLGAERIDNKEALIKAYTSFFDPTYKNNATKTAELSADALDKGIRVVTYDGRSGNLFNEEKERFSKQINKIDDLIYNNGISVSKLKSNVPGTIEHTLMLREIRKLLEENPEYQKRLDHIENAILSMRDNYIPSDIISSTITAELADKQKNLISIIGKAHQSGTISIEKTPLDDVQGIFNQGLTINGFKTTNALIGSNKEVINMLNASIFSFNNKQETCSVYNHI